MSDFDLLIQGAKVINGSGNPWFYGDVALKGQRIAAIAAPGGIPTEQVREVVDATGLVLCPGFIDILSHSIVPLMVDGRSLSKITQGVTTEIMGEGWTPAPFGGQLDKPLPHYFAPLIPEWAERIKGWQRFGDWLAAMSEHGVSPNFGAFLGGGTLRRYVKGMAMGRANEQELATMRRIMHEAMEDGAFGVSQALIYAPSSYCDTDELVDICQVVSQHKGIYITHIRSEADRLLEGLSEAIEIARRADLPVEIYHLKAAGKRNWPKIEPAIALIEQARRQGIDITADIYPYPAAGTGLASVLPTWAAANGQLHQNLRNPAIRLQIRAEVLNPSAEWEAMAELCGPEGVMPVGFTKPENLQYIGKNLVEIAEMRGQAWVDSVLDLLTEERGIRTIYYMMNERNVKRKLQLPWITIGTDAGGLDPAWASPFGPQHPRAYGSFPRILGKYVREEGVISLEEAIRKMSSAVADRLGIKQRGHLREGFYADLVLFDPQTITDRATFENSHQLSQGVQDVWINGVRVLKDGEHTGAKPGQRLNGSG